MREDVVALGQGDDDAKDQGADGACCAEGGAEGEVAFGYALGFPRAHEEDVCHEEGDPGEEAENGDKVDKVAEDGLGVAGDVHVCDAGNQ